LQVAFLFAAQVDRPSGRAAAHWREGRRT
jgi:hypothetical protein